MTEKIGPLRLGSDTHKQFAASLVLKAEPGWFLTLEPPKRGLLQNDAIHAKLRDISEQMLWPPTVMGQRWPLLTWKRLAMAAWLREEGEAPQMIPALDGNGMDIVYEQTSKLTIAQASRFLEWLTAFGAQNGVTFKDDDRGSA